MIRVVVADDHAVVRIGLRALLGAAPDIALVGEAADGDEVVPVCRDTAPDVVVMDLSMARVDGLEATRRVLALPTPPRVLALTMYDEQEYLSRALEAGVSGYVVKSAASADLLDAVRAVALGQTWMRPGAAGVAQRWAERAGRDELRAGHDALSDREREVFRLTAEGFTAARIGERLGLSPKTVDSYRRRIHDKLGIGDRADYVRIALALGILGAA